MAPIACMICGNPVTTQQNNGRPRKICARRACSHALRQQYDKAYRGRLKARLTKVYTCAVDDWALPRDTPPVVQPFSWWVAQAAVIRETCRKCEGPVEGGYVPPTKETMGECAVVAHCRLCGAERMVIAGRGGAPYTPEGLADARAQTRRALPGNGPRRASRRGATRRWGKAEEKEEL